MQMQWVQSRFLLHDQEQNQTSGMQEQEQDKNRLSLVLFLRLLITIRDTNGIYNISSWLLYSATEHCFSCSRQLDLFASAAIYIDIHTRRIHHPRILFKCGTGGMFPCCKHRERKLSQST